MASEREVQYPEQYSGNKEEQTMKRKYDYTVDTTYAENQQTVSGSEYLTTREDGQSGYMNQDETSECFTGHTMEQIQEAVDDNQTVGDGSHLSEQQGVSDGISHHSHEAVQEQPPCEAGAATTVTCTSLKPETEELLRYWKEKTDNLMDYWANVFRLSQEYETKAVEKMDLLVSKAQALDQQTQQQRDAALHRVQGIGKILRNEGP